LLYLVNKYPSPTLPFQEREVNPPSPLINPPLGPLPIKEGKYKRGKIQGENIKKIFYIKQLFS
jgi:hypothetical protein